MEIWCVAPSYEEPVAYFASFEAAERYLAEQAEYLVAWEAWINSPEYEFEYFTSPAHLDRDYPIDPLYISPIHVRE